MRTIKESEQFDVAPEKAFLALITPSSICTWWDARNAIVLPREGGVWVASWGSQVDQPDYIVAADIGEFDGAARMKLVNYRYYSKAGPLPFKASFETLFEVVGVAGNQSRLDVLQSGFPDDSAANDYYEGCVAGWRATLEALKKFLEC